MGLRILHCVEFYAPSVGGAQEVVRQVSERLAARGHRVTVATTELAERRELVVNGVEIEQFAVRGNEVTGIQGEVERYQAFVADGDFDVVMTYAAQQWTTDALLPIIDRLPSSRVLAPCGFSALRNPHYQPYFERLPERLQAFDALVFHSETYQDISFARAAGIDGIVVIPNGADEREFAELPPTGGFRARHRIGDGPLVLTVGGHTGLKGHAQAIAAVRHARTAADGTLAIVGNTPTGAGCRWTCEVRGRVARVAPPRRRIVLSDPPRPAVVEAYADADLFLLCSMVEASPLVLFEAMAAGLPFVSLDVGNAAEIAEWSGGGAVARSRRRDDGLVEGEPRDVATEIDRLLSDPELLAEVGESGRRAWAERFTWDAITSRYEALYSDLSSRGPAQR